MDKIHELTLLHLCGEPTAEGLFTVQGRMLVSGAEKSWSWISYNMRPKQKQGRREGSKARGESRELVLNRKIIAPEKLKILVLAGNDLTSEHLDFLNKCANLIKLDLSHNRILKLPPSLNLASLSRLEVLFLHHNKLSSLEAIHPVYKCSSLTYLTFHHNPLQETPRHEHEIVNALPSLKLINNRIVFIEERAEYLMVERSSVLTDTDTLQNWKSSENSEAYYLKVLSMQLQYIDNLWAFNNPIAIIQRAWRHFLPPSPSISPSSIRTRTLHSKLQHKVSKGRKDSSRLESHPLQKYFGEWKRFSEGMRSVRETMRACRGEQRRVDNSYMLLSLNQYKLALRNMRVRKPLQEYIRKIRQRIFERKMVKKFISNIRFKQTIFKDESSFYNISGIQQHKRFFYNKNQQHILENFLKIIAHTFNRREIIHSHSTCRVVTHLNAIRLVDPDSFDNKFSGNALRSICSLIWPSMKVVVSNRKVTASQFKAGIIGIPQLTYIRNRDKVLTKAQVAKSKEVYRRLEKFALNEYETSLWCFQCADEFVMRQLTRMIYYHNAKALKFQVKERRSEMLSLLENFQEPFIFYVDNVIKRTAAAVTIQKSWRRFISNKNQAESIYQKMKKNRAALHIQRFFRDSTYRHRLHFHKKLSQDLAQLRTNTIIFPLSMYMQFGHLDRPHPQSSLYKRLRITRSGASVGLSEEYYRPIFQQKIRDSFFNGQRLGTENYSFEVDIYHLLHYQVSVELLTRNGHKFVSFTYASEAEANIISSIIALLTYQPWGSRYMWPLTKQYLGQWERRINQYLSIKAIKTFISQFKQEPEMILNLAKTTIKEHGMFLWPSQTKFHGIAQTSSPQTIAVQFFQKRYHNFPVKQPQKFSYVMVNEKVQPKKEQDAKQQSQPPQQQVRRSQRSDEGPLNITTIDKRFFSHFEQSQKTIKHSELEAMSKTEAVVSQPSKRDKVMRFYQEEYVKKQAQREIKQTTLAGVRERARKEKAMNSTLRSLKEAERTEALRSKVQRIKQYKQRSAQKREEEDFVQQNNFVMQQQLKMIIMKNKLKDAEGRREQFLIKKSSMERNSDAFAPSIPSRKSSRQRQRAHLEEEESNTNEPPAGQTIGQEGSIVNIRRKARKTRAHSIGAYMRDPSFVHGVFPEEYYPIESRATSFYFPPVV